MWWPQISVPSKYQIIWQNVVMVQNMETDFLLGGQWPREWIRARMTTIEGSPSSRSDAGTVNNRKKSKPANEWTKLNEPFKHGRIDRCFILIILLKIISANCTYLYNQHFNKSLIPRFQGCQNIFGNHLWELSRSAKSSHFSVAVHHQS